MLVERMPLTSNISLQMKKTQPTNGLDAEKAKQFCLPFLAIYSKCFGVESDKAALSPFYSNHGGKGEGEGKSHEQ